MTIEAINSANVAATPRNIGRNAARRANIDAFINLDDDTLQKMAYVKTAQTVDSKKHKKLTNGLMNAVPVAAGLVAAAKMPVNRLGKILTATGVTAKWFAMFGIIDLVFAGKRKLEEKSEKANNFAQRNPFISFLAGAAAAFGAIALGGKGLNKLFSNQKVFGYLNKKGTKLDKAFTATSKFLENNKVLNGISERLGKVAEKTPSALKNVFKTAFEWLPLGLAVGSVIHEANHQTVKNREFVKNYEGLRDKQIHLAKMRNAELAVQNDFLKTNPQNVEDLKLVGME